MASQDAITDEGWLAHAAALRALAAALTSDASEAQDLVQETWLRARRREDPVDRPRSWWSAILRNLARDRAREQRQRAHNEREAAREEHLPSEVEVLERLESAQRVAAEVTRLDEPYRTAIHLRYFEGLSPEEIAQRSHAPLETVRARLRRGLALLRERMDRACGGDRSAWSVSLASIAFRGAPSQLATVFGSLISIGGIVVSAKIALGVAAAAVLGMGVYLMRPDANASRSDRETVVKAAAPAIVAPPAEKLVASEAQDFARTPVATPIVPVREVPDRSTIVVLDESGAEHASESGSFSLLVLGPKQQTVQVEVIDGSWSYNLPTGASYSVNLITLGGRSALALPNSGPFIASGQPPQLRCRWATVARLHVVDAVSGAELDGIRLYTLPPFEAGGVGVMLQRPKTGLVGENLISPIEVSYAPSDSGLPTHFAGRSGYAWGNIQIDPTAGGDFVLRLQPGGDLHATFEGASKDQVLRLRLYKKEGSDLEWVSEWGGQDLEHALGPPPVLELEGLVAANYVFRAEIGKQNEAKILAEQEFAVVAGQKTNVALLVGMPPTPGKTQVWITVKRDPTWTTERFNLWLKRLDDAGNPSGPGEHVPHSHTAVDDPGTWTSAPLMLVPGRYECSIDDLYFASEVIVGTDPRQQVLLEIPPPARVIVHTFDGDSGVPLTGAQYMCGWVKPGSRGHSG
ncbi:MAG: RNA polymerase sigma factor, partial [Planctomycetota bacterium]